MIITVRAIVAFHQFETAGDALEGVVFGKLSRVGPTLISVAEYSVVVAEIVGHGQTAIYIGYRFERIEIYLQSAGVTFVDYGHIVHGHRLVTGVVRDVSYTQFKIG